ncbi:recombination mediator RecR [Campylobacter troglodytis]|uniref:recombination mediator RecR n=1 Tax=Campylobacter troglodytis TaxID=654363 RepID=UPI00115BA5B4|nr:recombination mediator RecR [Campylobacter troglodytis]TQR61152.1 recombination protein RecR [Campylobacter troglodytis]
MSKKTSEKFNELVASFASLPTIGKKTAIRLAYFVSKNHLLGTKLAQDIENAIRFIKPCSKCGALSENECCEICSDEDRQRAVLCVVESARDVLILEESGSFNGLYFVLDELSDEKLTKLRVMIAEFGVKELIFAFTHSVNADAMSFFVEDKLKDMNLEFSKIAQGIPSGVHLENVDLISLHKAMVFRTKLK